MLCLVRPRAATTGFVIRQIGAISSYNGNCSLPLAEMAQMLGILLQQLQIRCLLAASLATATQSLLACKTSAG
jgi:hypothetical protein